MSHIKKSVFSIILIYIEHDQLSQFFILILDNACINKHTDIKLHITRLVKRIQLCLTNT